MWQFFLKRQQFVLKRSLRNEGFTMMEVLVSILVSTAFVMGTLQALLINAIYQVRAEREAQATFWIQQDIERVKAIAESSENELNTRILARCQQVSGANAFRDSYGGLLRRTLHEGEILDSTDNNKYSIPDGNGNKDENNQIAAEKNLVNKPYRMIRIVEGNPSGGSSSPANRSPRVLRLTYSVGEPDNSTTNKLKADNGQGFKENLAQVYTEVIPSGAFQCSTATP